MSEQALSIVVHRQPGTFPDEELSPILQAIRLESGLPVSVQVVESPLTQEQISCRRCLPLLEVPGWSAAALNVFLIPARAEGFADYAHVRTILCRCPSGPFLSKCLDRVMPAEGCQELARLQALAERGEQLFRQEKFELARDCFQAALRAQPESFTPLYFLGRLEMEAHAFREAEQWSRRALALQPQGPAVALLAAALARQKRWKEAIEVARQVDVKTYADQVALGQYLIAAKRYPEAETCLLEATQNHSDQVLGWLELARVYRVTGRHSDERDALRMAVKADPRNRVAWSDLSRVCAQLDDHTASAQAAHKAVLMGSGDAKLRALAKTYLPETTGPVRPPTPGCTLTEEGFWNIIQSCGSRPSESSEPKLVRALSQLKAADICEFDQILHHKLYLLDGYCFQIHGTDSSDGFLYERCYVVARGQKYFEMVLDNPSKFPGDKWFEELLYVVAEAYQMVCGEELDHQTFYSYETGSNKDQW